MHTLSNMNNNRSTRSLFEVKSEPEVMQHLYSDVQWTNGELIYDSHVRFVIECPLLNVVLYVEG